MTTAKNAAALTVAAITFSLCPTVSARADDVREAQWYVSYLSLARAHQITKGAGVTIAVVDTGVSRHIDIANNLIAGVDTATGGDGSGQTDKVGHGTMMAGIIAGHGHNTRDGVIGLAPGAKIFPVKALDTKVASTSLEQGIEQAAKAGADVINISGGTSLSRTLKDAIKSASDADSVIVAASGNKSQTPKIGQPAALPDVLAVGAVGKNGRVADFSVTDAKVEICAPGVDIVTTDRNNKYVKGSGTSEAAAIVSGAAALVRAKFPDLSAREVIHRLTATAKDNGPPGRDDQCGYGVLDIVAALTANVPPVIPSPSKSSSQAGPIEPSLAWSSDTAGTPPSGKPTAMPETAGSNFPVTAGIGATVLALATVIAFLVRHRRRP